MFKMIFCLKIFNDFFICLSINKFYRMSAWISSVNVLVIISKSFIFDNNIALSIILKSIKGLSPEILTNLSNLYLLIILLNLNETLSSGPIMKSNLLFLQKLIIFLSSGLFEVAITILLTNLDFLFLILYAEVVVYYQLPS